MTKKINHSKSKQKHVKQPKFRVGDICVCHGERLRIIAVYPPVGNQKEYHYQTGAYQNAICESSLVLDKNQPVSRWPLGYSVYHVDSLDGPIYRITSVTPCEGGTFEYSLIADTPNGFKNGKILQCMEHELVSCRERAYIKRTTVQQAKGYLQNRDLQISLLKDQLHEEKGRTAAYMGQIDTLRTEARDDKARLEGMREAFNAWCKAFPNMSPDQAARKMEQLERNRTDMMNASNGCIGEANKLRQVNSKLVEVITLLTR